MRFPNAAPAKPNPRAHKINRIIKIVQSIFFPLVIGLTNVIVYWQTKPAKESKNFAELPIIINPTNINESLMSIIAFSTIFSYW